MKNGKDDLGAGSKLLADSKYLRWLWFLDPLKKIACLCCRRTLELWERNELYIVGEVQLTTDKRIGEYPGESLELLLMDFKM